MYIITVFCSSCSVLVSVADSRPKVRYLVAVDDSQTTLEDLVRAISKNLGSGRVKHVPKEEALSNKNISVSPTLTDTIHETAV